jgi:hypothetical protein
MDVGLFVEGGVAGDSVARAARANLGDALDADRRAAACEFFQALVAKGMDHRTKTELIRGLGLVEYLVYKDPKSAQLNAVSANAATDTLDDEDFQLRAAQLAAAVGHELVSCLRAGDAAACADPSEPHAPPPPPGNAADRGRTAGRAHARRGGARARRGRARGGGGAAAVLGVRAQAEGPRLCSAGQGQGARRHGR